MTHESRKNHIRTTVLKIEEQVRYIKHLEDVLDSLISGKAVEAIEVVGTPGFSVAKARAAQEMMSGAPVKRVSPKSPTRARKGETKRLVSEALIDSGKPLSTAEIASITGLTVARVGNVLSALTVAGQAIRVSRGVYRWIKKRRAKRRLKKDKS